MFRKKRVLVVAGIFIVIIVIIGIVAYVTEGVKDNSSVTSIVPVNVKVFTARIIGAPQSIQAIGALSARKKVTISPEIAGQIKSVLFQYGETVKKGQPLYQLDDSLYQAQYQAAQSDLQLSKITYQRTERLAKRKAISQEALDKAQSTYQDALANLKVINVKLNKMQIHAPFSGIIGASNVDIGQFVKIGASLVQLVDKAGLISKFSVPEQYLNQVAIGQSVTINSSAFPQQTFNGTVNYISPTVDPTTRTLMIWAGLPNPTLKLAPGLFVHVTLHIDTKKNAILIPQETLIPTVEGNDIYIVKDGKGYKRAVTIGQTIGNQVEILKGLQPGDTVVILGQEKLSNGRSVKVVR